VANVEQAMIVFAMTNPEPNLNLLDRFLVMMEFQDIETIICFNKTDIGDEEFAQKLLDIYTPAGYKVVFTSTKEKENIHVIEELLNGKTTVLAGPSGVGKSSMLNVLALEQKMETGSVSEKIGRGRHTTRHSEIFPIGHNTYVIDTPGFTSLDVPGMDETVLGECMPEFREYIGNCKFVGCAHISEPSCAIKEALEEKKISRERYDNYCAFYNELRNRRKY
ncbi:MAG: ribosome small subunit-dependent GTPase A, partial [Lachnospiraceae bacterium]|nr:ribosome small subunit-dependent GTPase A [Lachnospiraceae bacterium]